MDIRSNIQSETTPTPNRIPHLDAQMMQLLLWSAQYFRVMMRIRMLSLTILSCVFTSEPSKHP